MKKVFDFIKNLVVGVVCIFTITTSCLALSFWSSSGGGISATDALVAASLTLTGNITMGSASASLPIFTMSKDEAGTNFIAFVNEGTQRAYVQQDPNEALTLMNQIAGPVNVGTNNATQVIVGSTGSVALWYGGSSNQTPAHLSIGGTNATYGIDGSTATGATTLIVPTNSPAGDGTADFHVRGYICNSVGTDCVAITWPVWRY